MNAMEVWDVSDTNLKLYKKIKSTLNTISIVKAKQAKQKDRLSSRAKIVYDSVGVSYLQGNK